jgi:hypothetical protein
MVERKFKFPNGVMPAFDKGRIVFKMRPRLFGWLWCPIPSLTTKYVVDYNSREVVVDKWFGGIKSLPIDSVPDVPSSFVGWFFGRGNILLEKDSVKLELKSVKNPKDFIDFLKALKDPNFVLPSFGELNAQRVVPFWTKWFFTEITSTLYPSFIPYARFMRRYPYYDEEMTVEEVIHNSEELMSFVQSNPQKPVTKMILFWLNRYYLDYLNGVFYFELNDVMRGLREGDYKMEHRKKKFKDFQNYEKLKERHDILNNSWKEAYAKSLWVTTEEKPSLKLSNKVGDFLATVFVFTIFPLMFLVVFIKVVEYFLGVTIINFEDLINSLKSSK